MHNEEFKKVFDKIYDDVVNNNSEHKYVKVIRALIRGRSVILQNKSETMYKDMMDLCEKVLFTKSAEYSDSKDRLHNFYASFNLFSKEEIDSYNIDPILIARMYQQKHIASVNDMLMTGNPVSVELANEKFGDAINYCILIEALRNDKNGYIKWEKEHQFYTNFIDGEL